MGIKVFFAELKLYTCNHIINKIPSHRFRLWFYRYLMHYKIGKDATIALGCTFDTAGHLTIGDKTVINARCRLDSRGGLDIGTSVSISCDTIILTADHDPNDRMSNRERPVVIKPFVFIATRSMILPGVTIESHSFVAAGSVVSKNIPSGQIVGGVPAKIIKSIPDGILTTYTEAYKRLFH